MTLSETVGEGIISVAISGGSFRSLPGQYHQVLILCCFNVVATSKTAG